MFSTSISRLINSLCLPATFQLKVDFFNNALLILIVHALLLEVSVGTSVSLTSMFGVFVASIAAWFMAWSLFVQLQPLSYALFLYGHLFETALCESALLGLLYLQVASSLPLWDFLCFWNHVMLFALKEDNITGCFYSISFIVHILPCAFENHCM